MAEVWRIPKRTGTHADALCAVGLATLLAEVVDAADVILADKGDAFEVSAPDGTEAAIAEAAPPSAGYPFISEKGEPPPAGADWVDYPAQSEREKRYWEGRQRLRTEKQPAPEMIEAVEQDRPPPWWRRAKAARTLQAHLTANKVVEQVAALSGERFRADVGAALLAFGRGERSGLGWKAEQVQAYNPPAAKGYARLKPDSTGRNDNTTDAWGDAFAEWLRMRGFHVAAIPYATGSKSEHVRILTPRPGEIPLVALRRVADEVPARAAGGRGMAEAKLDSLALLALTRLLVEHSSEYQIGLAQSIPPWLSLEGAPPSRAVAGVYVTHYQSLGQSRAVGAMQQLAVPGWFGVSTHAEAQEWIEVLDEHRAGLLSLDDKHSDEIGILIAYRRFLQSPEDEGAPAVAEAFLDFLGQYGCFLIRAREGQRGARQFTTKNVRRVLMGITAKSGGYGAILDDPGFQAVATAVRKATVSAQAQKSMKQAHVREVRYDLLPDLRRKSGLADGDELMAKVAEFVALYNAENARRREMGRPAPRNVTTEEFRSFAGLVETHGPAKVGPLLCAFGSCREPQEPDAPEPSTDDTPSSDAENAD